MQLCITSANGKTSATLDGVALEGLIAFELTAPGPGKPILFKPIIRVGSGLELSLDGGSHNGSGDIRDGLDRVGAN